MTQLEFWLKKRQYSARVIFGPGRQYLSTENIAAAKRQYLLALVALDAAGWL